MVRLLLESSTVDCFAKTTLKGQTALDIARQNYRTLEGRGVESIQCVEHIEKVRSNWVDRKEYVDNDLIPLRVCVCDGYRNYVSIQAISMNDLTISYRLRRVFQAWSRGRRGELQFLEF